MQEESTQQGKLQDASNLNTKNTKKRRIYKIRSSAY